MFSISAYKRKARGRRSELLGSRTMSTGRWARHKNLVILSVTRHRQNPLGKKQGRQYLANFP
jgi:hypothetical protein